MNLPTLSNMLLVGFFYLHRPLCYCNIQKAPKDSVIFRHPHGAYIFKGGDAWNGQFPNSNSLHRN